MSTEKNLEAALEKAKKVKLFGHDVHGVLTTNVFYCDVQGGRRYGFWHMDGFGDIALFANGIQPAFLDSTSIDEEGFHRAQEIKMDKFYYKVTDKVAKVDELVKALGITYENVGYVGCEVTDIDVMKKAGFAVATADAIDEVKEIADYITKATGGRGVIREICEVILRSMDKWDSWVDKVTKQGYK